MKFAYISQNKMYYYDGTAKELKSERVAHYTETVRTIAQNKEWKQTGTGAMFTGVYRQSDYSGENHSITGLAWDGKGIVYSMVLGGMGAIYRKFPDKPDSPEEHIFTSMDHRIGSISFNGERIAAEHNGHIALYDLKGDYTELTDGDSYESDPRWSQSGKELLCTSMGRAYGSEGVIYSSGALLSIDLDAGTMDEIYTKKESDCVKPSRSRDGSLWFIRQPYKQPKTKTPLWKDILLFPVRIIKAIIGFLNAFTTIFGGEPLRDGGKRSDVKSKQKSERELFFEGRLIEAEKNQRENEEKGEKNPGIFPSSRVLVKVSQDGEETIVKRGVQDYVLLENGGLLVSNGKSIIHIDNGEETVLTKAELAHDLCVITE